MSDPTVPATNCPCIDRHASKSCAACSFRNRPGHQRPEHRGFVRVLDPTGTADMCTLCATSAVINGAEWGAFDVTLLLGAPAVEMAG